MFLEILKFQITVVNIFTMWWRSGSTVVDGERYGGLTCGTGELFQKAKTIGNSGGL